MRNGKIYVLTDPVTRQHRYIGQTWYELSSRLCGHLTDAKRGYKTHTCYWIRQIGCDPIITLLQENIETQDELNAAECSWMELFTKQGCELTNIRGGGSRGLFTDEQKKRLSIAHKGQKSWHAGKPWSDEHKKKLSAGQLRRFQRPEEIEKIRQAHLNQKPTPESILKGRITRTENDLRKLRAQILQEQS